MGVTARSDTAIATSFATTFVLTLSALVSHLLYHQVLLPLNLAYLDIVAFIVTIAAVVQFTELFCAFKASGARIACVCSSDDVYADMAEDVVQELKRAGALRVLLAGRPGEQEPRLKAAGVDGFVFAGQDMVAFLGTLQDDLIAD